MVRKFLIIVVFAFGIGLVGCRTCWTPYDHCQPTFVPEAGDQCMGPLYRNGSVLGGMERRENGESGCTTCGGADADFATEPIQTVSYSGGAPTEIGVKKPTTEVIPPPPTRPAPETIGADTGIETIPTPGPVSVTPLRTDRADFHVEEFPLADEDATIPRR